MIKFYNYHNDQLSEVENDIVASALTLARETYDDKKGEDYNERNKFLLGKIAQYALEGTKFASEDSEKALEALKRPIVHNNSNVRDNFNLVLTQVVTAIVPEVANDIFSRFISEVHQIGWGDTATFTVESNDLFAVKEKAEGVRRGVDQPMYDDEITVAAHPITIDTHIDWYPFVSGRFDFGYFALKIARSFSAYIFIKAVKGMTNAFSVTGNDTATQFGAAWTVNGVDQKNWGTLRERISAANGGMNVIAVGTEIALSKASLGGNFQVEIGERMNSVGYLDQYLNTPLLAIKNVLKPGHTNTDGALALPDNVIYMIPVAGDKPVKIVFEGNEVSVSYDPEHTSDVRYGISIEMRIGVSAICGSKYGLVKLAE